MFHGLLKSKFYSKCKSCIKLTKTRIETIRRKRNAMEKYLKNDISDLLKNGLDSIAYGRAEGLLVEQNLSQCYNLVEQSCVCISSHLSTMNKQRECPEECREAVSTLMFAAARFSDLPELRELRSKFAERYGNFLECFVNKEFVEKSKPISPTKDMKLQLLQDIALEVGIEWDSKFLEQKLYKPPASAQDWSKKGNDDKHNDLPKDNHQNGWKTNIQGAGLKHSNLRDYTLDERKEEDPPRGTNLVTSYKNQGALSYKPKKSAAEYAVENRNPVKSASEDAVENRNHFDFKSIPPSPKASNARTGFEKSVINQVKNASEDAVENRNSFDFKSIPPSPKAKNSLNTVKSASEDEVENKNPFNFKSMPPPYTKTKVGKNEISKDVTPSTSGREETLGTKQNDHFDGEREIKAKPVPRSVRRRPAKPPPGHEEKRKDSKPGLKILNGEDQRDEEERQMDKLLMHYSKRSLPSQPALRVEEVVGVKQRSRSSTLQLRTTSFPMEQTNNPATEATKGHARAASFQPDMLNPAGHVHPKLPDYDDFVARLAVLRQELK